MPGAGDAGGTQPPRSASAPAALDALVPGLQLASLTASLPAQDQPLTLAAEATLRACRSASAARWAPRRCCWPGAAARKPWPLDLSLSAATATAALKGTIADPAGAPASISPWRCGCRSWPPSRRSPAPAARGARHRPRYPNCRARPGLRRRRLPARAAPHLLGGGCGAAELTYVVGQRQGLAGSLTSSRIDLDALRPPAAAPNPPPPRPRPLPRPDRPRRATAG